MPTETPREPDRDDKRTAELFASGDWRFHDRVAAALRAVEASALERAARAILAEERRRVEHVLPAMSPHQCADLLRALASPAAAPGWTPPRDAMTGMTAAEEMRAAGIDVLRGARPAAAPAPGVEDVARAHRRYDAMAVHPLDPLVRVIVEPCERGGHYRNERGATFHPSPCVEKPGAGEGTK